MNIGENKAKMIRRLILNALCLLSSISCLIGDQLGVAGQTVSDTVTFDPGWTFDRKIWSEVLFFWPGNETKETANRLLTVSSQKMTEYKFMAALDAWQTKTENFQYLRLSCSVVQTGMVDPSCLCTTYAKLTVNANPCINSSDLCQIKKWTPISDSPCSTLPPLTVPLFKDFSNLTVIEFTDVELDEVEPDAFRNLSALKLVRFSRVSFANDDITNRVPLCGLLNLPFLQIYDTVIKLNGSDNGPFRLLRCDPEHNPDSTGHGTGIRVLEIRNSSVTALDKGSFAGLDRKSLHSISLSGNLIRAIDNYTFSVFTELTEMDISWNQLTKLENRVFSELNSLTALNLAFNLLETIDTSVFHELVSLKNLNLTGNRIVCIIGGFGILPSLMYLDLRLNRISSLSEVILSNCQRLTDLWLGQNEISEIHEDAFNETASLKFLDLSENLLWNETNIKNFMQYHLEWLKVLILKSNNINRLTAFMFKADTHVSHLQTIDLTSNKIEFVDKDAFTNLGDLRELMLGQNRISKLNPKTFKTNKKLLALYLMENLIEFLPDDLLPDSLGELYLASNRISRLPLLKKVLPNLKTLNLRGNKLPVLDDADLFQFPALEALDISNCNLSRIPDKFFFDKTQLQFVDMSGNNINLNFSINYFRNSSRLNFLNLSHNSIRSAENLFQQRIHSVSLVDLSYNPLFSFPDQPKKALIGENLIFTERLIMRNCSLEKIAPASFELALRIDLIDLSANRLSEFEPLQLSDLTTQLKTQILLTIILSNAPVK